MSELPGSRFYLGLDLGQARDYSAIAVAERRVELTGTRDFVTYELHRRIRVFVRYLERIPLRTPYPEVVERVRYVVQRYHATQTAPLQILMDATGVGGAVKDMLRAAQLKVPIVAVTITGGERARVVDHGAHYVPCHDLLANLRVLLEKRMLRITAAGPVTEALRTELFRWGRRSAHDDLVFAVALACWKAGGQHFSLWGNGPLPMVYPDSRSRPA